MGPWASEKLECLRKYLHAYTAILRKQTWCEKYIYIDAFAGAGRARLRTYEDAEPQANSLFELSEYMIDGEAEGVAEYIHGSPRVALDLIYPFSEYVFVEKSLGRIAELSQLVAEFGGKRRIHLLNGDANEQLVSHISNYNWKKCRAVAFLDPFGMQVPWDTIVSLGETNAIELILNLPIGMAIQRMLPKSGQFTPDEKKRLDSYFGSEEWFDVVYDRQIGLFGPETQKNSDAGERLALWYMKRLERVYGYAARPRLIRNTKGSHLYYLLWAGPNKTAAKIAGDVLKQGAAI